MKKYQILMALALLPLLAACAGSAVPAKPGEGGKYVFENYSYERLWDAAMIAAGHNISIDSSNEAAGVIRGHAAGTEEIGIFFRRDSTDPLKTQVEVAGGKRRGLTITSSFYTSKTAKNWPNIIFKEMNYELTKVDPYSAYASAQRPGSMRLEDMSPEQRSAGQTSIRAQVHDEIRSQRPPEARPAAQGDIRAQIREEVRRQMEYERQTQTQGRAAPVAAPRVTQRVTAPRAPAVPPSAPASIMPPLPTTTLSLRERLGELKALYQDQLIGKAEYESKKAAILKDL